MISHEEQSFRRVVIIGGGLAGISAAESLARDHRNFFRVTLLESKRFLGGRAGSFCDSGNQEVFDYCQHVAMGCCTNLLGLLRRFELSDALNRFERLTFFHPLTEPSCFTASKWLPAPFHLSNALRSLRFLNPSQKREIRLALFRLMRTPSGSPTLAKSTAYDWLKENRQGEETIHLFWDVILTSALGERCRRVSMASARKVFIDGFAAAKGASDVLIPNRPLRTLFGVEMPAKLSELGVDVRCQSRVQSIEGAPNDSAIIRLSDGTVLNADHVICAVPWHSVGRLFNDSRLANAIENVSLFASIPSSPITGVHLWLDRKITELPNAVFVGTLSQWLFREPFRDFAESSTHYYQVVISASHSMNQATHAEIVDQVMAELRHFFPEARGAKLVRDRLVTDPNSVFSIRPEVHSLRPVTQTRLPWLSLAGDWTQTGWPSTMEGAVISGVHAAASVLQRSGLPLVFPEPELPRGWIAKLLIAK